MIHEKEKEFPEEDLTNTNSSIAKEKDKIFMIVKSNTISNPRTMMIHS